MARFAETFCSQCGGSFGPGEEGFSHCEDHKGFTNLDDVANPTPEQVREQVRGSDEFSPGVKKAMEHFWKLIDRQSR